MKQTAIQEMINEFNKELNVATQIGNEDKIRITKHLINIASKYLEMEEKYIIEAFEEGDWCNYQKNDITGKDYYQLNFKSE
jgi:hypothetical protein